MKWNEIEPYCVYVYAYSHMLPAIAVQRLRSQRLGGKMPRWLPGGRGGRQGAGPKRDPKSKLDGLSPKYGIIICNDRWYNMYKIYINYINHMITNPS